MVCVNVNSRVEPNRAAQHVKEWQWKQVYVNLLPGLTVRHTIVVHKRKIDKNSEYPCARLTEKIVELYFNLNLVWITHDDTIRYIWCFDWIWKLFTVDSVPMSWYDETCWYAFSGRRRCYWPTLSCSKKFSWTPAVIEAITAAMLLSVLHLVTTGAIAWNIRRFIEVVYALMLQQLALINTIFYLSFVMDSISVISVIAQLSDGED